MFKVNCERCGGLLIKGEIYNYRGKTLCDDCYVLLYVFGREAPDTTKHRTQKQAQSQQKSPHRFR